MHRALAEPQLALVAARGTESEARRVMAWRNDPVTRAMSYHSHERVWPAYFDEYRRYFANPATRRATRTSDAAHRDTERDPSR